MTESLYFNMRSDLTASGSLLNKVLRLGVFGISLHDALDALERFDRWLHGKRPYSARGVSGMMAVIEILRLFPIST